jgi:putative membrane protein
MLLTLPLNIVTLGLFSFVINAALILGLASFVDGFDVAGFVPALLGGLVIAVVAWIVDRIIK